MAEDIAFGATTDERGATTISPKVLKAVATAAALSVDGCVRHSSGLNRLAGRSYPFVEVRSLNTSVDAQVQIAVSWPCAASEVAERVRQAIATELVAMAAIPVLRVDVHIAAAVPSGQRLADIALPLASPPEYDAAALRHPSAPHRSDKILSPKAPGLNFPAGRPVAPGLGFSITRPVAPGLGFSITRPVAPGLQSDLLHPVAPRTQGGER